MIDGKAGLPSDSKNCNEYLFNIQDSIFKIVNTAFEAEGS
jgi:hypothetical protein